MSGLEIFLLVLVVVFILVIAYQARQNRELARHLWQEIAKSPRVETLPPTAETIALAAFHRATDRRDTEIEALREQLAEAKVAVHEKHLQVRRWANDCITEADRAEVFKTRLAAVERERDCLVRDLQKYRQKEGFIAVVH